MRGAEIFFELAEAGGEFGKALGPDWGQPGQLVGELFGGGAPAVQRGIVLAGAGFFPAAAGPAVGGLEACGDA